MDGDFYLFPLKELCSLAVYIKGNTRTRWNRQLPKMTDQNKTDYICIFKESEGPAPDTLDETLQTNLKVYETVTE